MRKEGLVLGLLRVLVQFLRCFQHRVRARRRRVSRGERAAGGQVRSGADSLHRAEGVLTTMQRPLSLGGGCVAMESQMVLQLQLRESRPRWTSVLGIGVFPGGQGQGIVLAVVLAKSLIADGGRIAVVAGGSRRQRLFEVEGIRIGFLQDLGARLWVVGRSPLRRR